MERIILLARCDSARHIRALGACLAYHDLNCSPSQIIMRDVRTLVFGLVLVPRLWPSQPPNARELKARGSLHCARSLWITLWLTIIILWLGITYNFVAYINSRLNISLVIYARQCQKGVRLRWWGGKGRKIAAVGPKCENGSKASRVQVFTW